MLKHYCETGEMLNTNGFQRKKEFTDLIFSPSIIFFTRQIV